MPAGPPEPRANPDLLGQEAALGVLGRALGSGRLPHGWLFSGPEGIGKATLAYRFARALLAGPEAVRAALDLAPEHPVFRQVAQGAHPDLTVLEPERDPKTGRVKSEIPVGAVRAATAALHATAAMGGYRVVVIDGAERLNRNAANALLKSLEEPPAGGGADPDQSPPGPGRRDPALALRQAAARPVCRIALVAEGLARWAPSSTASSAARSRCFARGSLGRALGAGRRRTGCRCTSAWPRAWTAAPPIAWRSRSVARAGAPRRAARLRRPARDRPGAARPGRRRRRRAALGRRLFAGEAEALGAAGPPAPP